MTSREFAQTIGLLDRFGIDAHGRGRPRRRLAPRQGPRDGGTLGRAGALRARRAASTWPWPTAAPTSRSPRRAAGTPQVTMFDYEHAAAMHHWNGRLATRVLVPAAIPEEALARYGMRPPRLVRYPGLKEEYYLADHALDDSAVDELGLDRERVVAVVRPPPEVTLYHRGREHRAVRRDARADAGGGARGPDRRAAAHRGAAAGAGGRAGDRARAGDRRARAWWPPPTWSSAPAAR